MRNRIILLDDNAAAGTGGQLVTDDLASLRAALAMRVEACWDRLDDAVSELVALHEVTDDVIVERVRLAIAAESPNPASSEPA